MIINFASVVVGSIAKKSVPVAIAVTIVLGAIAPMVIAQVPIGVDIKGQRRDGTCYSSQRSRPVCYFPSRVAAYENLLAVEHRGGSGADVWWKTVRVNGEYKTISSLSGSLQGKVAEVTASASYEESGKKIQVDVTSTVLGETKYNQQPYNQNPYRYAPTMVMIRPHNTSWQTDFRVIGE